MIQLMFDKPKSDSKKEDTVCLNEEKRAEKIYSEN
jgi:hypothetical protein